jgi:hypothetical protein
MKNTKSLLAFTIVIAFALCFVALSSVNAVTTANVTVDVNDHLGNGINGVPVRYYYGSWHTFGTTNATGKCTLDLPVGNYAFDVNYAYTVQQKWQPISGDDTVVFQTALVTMKVLASGGVTELTGTNAQYYTGTWHTFGTGTTTTSMELLPGNYAFKVSYNGATQQNWQDVAGTNTAVIFQTTLVTMKVLASGGVTEVTGTNAQYYTGTWYTFDSGSTTSSMELLPASYAFGVTYNGAWQQKWQTIGTGPTEVVVFYTTKVTLQFSGTIKYYTGVWNTFTKPSMDLFQGTYPFQFDGYQTNIIVGASDIQESIVVVKFLKSGGAGIAGGAAKYYDGSWHAMGTTDGNGILIYEIPGLKGNLAFSMSYAGATTQKWQNIKDDSIVIFHTAPVTMKLLAHDGTTVLMGMNPQYYTGTWNNFGTLGHTTDSMELLPGSYAFKLSYSGASQQKWQTIGLDPTDVVFQTSLVTMELKDHSGGSLTGTNPKCYTGVWNIFGTGDTPTSMELLPGNYAFSVSYNGATQQKWQVVSGPTDNVVFTTTLVTMKLQDHLGSSLTGTNPKYYTGIWNSFGSLGYTTDSMELLPGNYAFMVSYAGTTNQKWQVVSGSTIDVVFQTTSVTMTLLAHDGTTVLTGKNPKCYTGVWNIFGTGDTPTSMELLPGNYAFSVSYNGATQQKWQDVGSNPNVVFHTTEVTIKVEKADHTELAGTDAKYYTGVWNTFGTGNTIGSKMELLPGNYAFMVSYAGTTNQKWQTIGTGPSEVVIFTTTLVTMKVLASDGTTELAGTNAQYYTGTWLMFDSGSTTSSMELLPGNYAFKVSYNGATQQKWQNVGTDPNVVFQTTRVTFHFSGDINYYFSSWNTFTKPSMELLAGNYAFSFGGSGYPTKQVWLSICGSVYEKTVAYIRVLKSTGSGQSGATATWWDWGGPASAVLGNTDGNGVLLNFMDGSHTNVLVTVTYDDATSSFINQNPNSNSFFVFQMVRVKVELRDNAGNLITSGPQPTVYYWPYGKPEQTFGTMSGGQVSKDLLPGSFLFKIKDYQGSTQQLGPINNPTTVVFQTGKVLDGGYGCTQYHQYGGPTKTFTNGIQLLPGNFYFDPGSKNLQVIAGQTLDLKTGTYTTP